MMKYLTWILCSLTLCSGHFIAAEDACHSECEDCCANGAVYVDYLYWKVNRSGLTLPSNKGPTNLTPAHHSGFRLGARGRCDCWDFGVRYTYFDNRDSKKFEPVIFQGVNQSEAIDNLTAKYSIDYDIIDIELGYNFDCLCACSDVSIRPFAGAKLAWIDEEFNTQLEFLDKVSTDFKGYGLYAGAEGNWTLCNWQACGCYMPLSLVLKGTIGILDGEFKTSGGDIIIISGVTTNRNIAENARKKEWIYVPYHELFAGLNLGYCGSCVDANLMVGYETQTWSGWRQGFIQDVVLGLGGLVVRLNLGF